MTVAKNHRLALLGLALFGLLGSVLAATATPTSAATAASPTHCTEAVFFGLHGMGEGPSPTMSAISPELLGFDHEQNLISGAVGAEDVSYPTVGEADLNVNLAGDAGALTGAVLRGEVNLQNDVHAWVSGCQLGQLKIALVGYSMGAWVINDWLNFHPNEWKFIKAVVLYGDPCWINGADKGLIRAAKVAGLAGCMSAKTYPKPAATSLYKPGFKTEIWCVGGDPICGGGYKGNFAKMLPKALACKSAACAHWWYRLNEPAQATLKDGAQFVVDQLGGDG